MKALTSGNRELISVCTDLQCPLHPINDLAVETLLNRDMHHRRCRRCPEPVLLSRLEPNDISGTDFLYWSAFALNPAISAVTMRVCPKNLLPAILMILHSAKRRPWSCLE
jgi:hypothetical protein